jgi:hypothetical protein
MVWTIISSSRGSYGSVWLQLNFDPIMSEFPKFRRVPDKEPYNAGGAKQMELLSEALQMWNLHGRKLGKRPCHRVACPGDRLILIPSHGRCKIVPASDFCHGVCCQCLDSLRRSVSNVPRNFLTNYMKKIHEDSRRCSNKCSSLRAKTMCYPT